MKPCIDNKPDKYKLPCIRIPYISNSSLILKKKLKQIFKRYGLEINIIFSAFKVRNYFSLKCKTDSLLRSSLVYKFQCPVDPSSVYIGKTKRYLNKRVSEHISAPSAIHEHRKKCITCNENDDFIDLFSVLDKSNSDFELRILEALHIRDKNPSLNKQLLNNGSSFMLNIF